MKYLIAVLVLLAAPVAAKACDPLGVCSQAVVQNFGVLGNEVQIQTVVPTVAVQTFAVQAFAVPQAVVVQDVCHRAVVRGAGVRVLNAPRVIVQNVRPPRQVIRNKQVIRQR